MNLSRLSKTATLSAVFLLCYFVFAYFDSFASDDMGGARISLVRGKALVQGEDEEEWVIASVNYPLVDGDRVLTEWDGRIELQTASGTYVRLGENSQLAIRRLNFDSGRDFLCFSLVEGRVYVNHKPRTGKVGILEMDFPAGIVRAFGSAKFGVNLDSREVQISVHEGSIEYEEHGRAATAGQGNTVVITENGAELRGIALRDDWDRWNMARDYELAGKQYARRYLPPSLEPWERDLEGYGRWVYVTEYRYVWVPVVPAGWVPFRHGYWTWRRGIYCWVPREPWGWLPFHYGRWAHHHVYGWIWIPPVSIGIFWHPGAVAWYIGPSFIAWVPLAPGEVYYGYPHHKRHHVDNTGVSIQVQKSVYVNARIPRAVVTVQKESFYSGRPLVIEHKDNPFLQPARITPPPTEKPSMQAVKALPSRPVANPRSNINAQNAVSGGDHRPEKGGMGKEREAGRYGRHTEDAGIPRGEKIGPTDREKRNVNRDNQVASRQESTRLVSYEDGIRQRHEPNSDAISGPKTVSKDIKTKEVKKLGIEKFSTSKGFLKQNEKTRPLLPVTSGNPTVVKGQSPGGGANRRGFAH